MNFFIFFKSFAFDVITFIISSQCCILFIQFNKCKIFEFLFSIFLIRYLFFYKNKLKELRKNY